jgi:hypothetical protein
MSISRYIPILSDMEESQGQAHPPAPYPLHDNLIVSEPVTVIMRSWGAYVYPFINTAQILYYPNGRSEKLDKSGMIFKRDEGVYSVVYVDLCEFSHPIMPITTTSSDGWRVTLNVNVTWKVRDAYLIASMKDPVTRLTDQVRSAVTHYIHSKTFVQLVPMPGGEPLPEHFIIAEILNLLLGDPALQNAYEIIGLTIRDRTGDPRMSQTIHDAILRHTELAHAQNVEIERLKSELEVQKQKYLFVQKRGDVNVATARAEVNEETERINLQINQADAEARIWEKLRKVKEEMVVLERLRAKNKLDQQQFTRFLEIAGQAFSDLSEISRTASMTPGFQPNTDFNKIFDDLLKAFDAIMKAYP